MAPAAKAEIRGTLDVEKQVAYWRDGAPDAFRSVPTLRENGFWREALFWAHLGVEKAFKAHVVRVTRAVPPYIHNLLRLAEIAQIELSAGQIAFCNALNECQREARYPDLTVPEPDATAASKLLDQAEEMSQWLLKRL